ncbi:hypothetical protein B0H63DRAFT_513702 [Podospora didyma]|uniref:non-specific serine/threonine protein kinase n=1 Tax=Podospora didyma TaxID=330526 RepID=A0AAE0K9R9_9PEZI|nr:hypothetical protein B0H63DRAFT_513702 [Podospora didyma]
MDASDRDVEPDEHLLDQIFGSCQPAANRVILQNCDNCIFKAIFSPALENGVTSYIVRLEATIQVGVAENDQGRQFQFCVMECVNRVTLEEAWGDMSTENRDSIASAVVEALAKMQTMRLSDAQVTAILRPILAAEGNEALLDKPIMGGPSTGFMENGAALLTSIKKLYKLKRPFCNIQEIADPKGLKVISSYEDLGSLKISDLEMSEWLDQAVLCHNDLTPRNIMVRLSGQDAYGNTTYNLAAIIDWELQY